MRQVKSRVENPISDQIWNQFTTQVDDQVREQVRERANDLITIRIYRQVHDQAWYELKWNKPGMN